MSALISLRLRFHICKMLARLRGALQDNIFAFLWDSLDREASEVPCYIVLESHFPKHSKRKNVITKARGWAQLSLSHLTHGRQNSLLWSAWWLGTDILLSLHMCSSALTAVHSRPRVFDHVFPLHLPDQLRSGAGPHISSEGACQTRLPDKNMWG